MAIWPFSPETACEFTNVIEVSDWIGANEFIHGGNSLEEIQIFGAILQKTRF